MGKGLNGKELGKGIRQRKDGRYEARIYNPGTPKYVSLYDTNLQRLKKTRNAYLEGKRYGVFYNKEGNQRKKNLQSRKIELRCECIFIHICSGIRL